MFCHITGENSDKAEEISALDKMENGDLFTVGAIAYLLNLLLYLSVSGGYFRLSAI